MYKINNNDYDHIFKIILSGDSGVGKTSILAKFCSNKFETDISSTIGIEFATKIMDVHDSKLNEDVKVKLQIWDTAGQEKYNALTSVYYRNAAIVVIVYDVTRYNTFNSAVNYWAKQAKDYADKDVILILVGNKADLFHIKAVESSQAEEISKMFKMHLMETSPKEDYNIDKLFNLIAELSYQKFNDGKYDINNISKEINKEIIEEKKNKLTNTSISLFSPYKYRCCF